MGLVVFCQGLLNAADLTLAKPWKSETNFSYVSSNGNSKTASTSGKEDYLHKWSKTTMELIGGGQGAKDSGKVTAESYYASEKFDYALAVKDYAFEKGDWDRNKFSGINDRYQANVGFGRNLIKNQTDLLIGELGAGYVNEDRVNNPRNDFASGRAYTKFTHKLSATAEFDQDLEFIQSMKSSEDFRMNTETDLIATLTNHFSLKLSYKWQHVQKPPTGFGRNDTFTTISLVANY